MEENYRRGLVHFNIGIRNATQIKRGDFFPFTRGCRTLSVSAASGCNFYKWVYSVPLEPRALEAPCVQPTDVRACDWHVSHFY